VGIRIWAPDSRHDGSRFVGLRRRPGRGRRRCERDWRSARGVFSDHEFALGFEQFLANALVLGFRGDVLGFQALLTRLEFEQHLVELFVGRRLRQRGRRGGRQRDGRDPREQRPMSIYPHMSMRHVVAPSPSAG